ERLEEERSTQIAVKGVLPSESHPAQHLLAVTAGRSHEAPGEDLGQHGRMRVRVFPGRGDGGFGALLPHAHLGEAVLNRLERPDGGTELVPARDVVDGEAE